MRPEWRTTAALIIPALNEEAVIGLTLSGVPPDTFHVVVVADNGSNDRTAEIARAHGATVTHAQQRGYGFACLAAIRQLPPEVNVLVFMQADASEDPWEAGPMLTLISNGRADLVIGSRILGKAEPGSLLPHQVFGNHLALSLIRLLYRYSYTDIGPFRAIRRDAYERLEMRETRYGWTVEMQVRAIEEQLRIAEVPVSYRVRAAGQNKVSGNLRASVQAGLVIIATIVRLWLRRHRGSVSRTRSQ